MKRRRIPSLNIPEKANRILNGILVAMLVIVVRIWHLAIVQHPDKVKEARRPQERSVVEKAERASIVDRFGIPLALNKVQYNVYLSYGPIRDLPRTVWKKNEEGKKVKYPYRKAYISDLSEFLGSLLSLDALYIEDLIHSRAAILGNAPCLLKENISEKEYFKLKMLEKDWPGIHAEIAAKRCYPLGAIGGEVIGYLGPISRSEYDAVTHELKQLRDCLQNWEEGAVGSAIKESASEKEVRARLEELEKKAYTLNDFVGKAGVESAFDESLRGSKGKRIYLSDTRGNFLSWLPGSEPAKPGSALVLSISAELQEYAETLLAEYDASQSQRAAAHKLKALLPENQPWIKGGAIVAIDPKTGKLLALASFPRFNPNDFILTGSAEEIDAKKRRVHRWLEDEKNISDIWNLKVPLTRERFNSETREFEEEEKEIGWEAYLGFILPKKSPVREQLGEKNTLADALFLQKKIDALLALFHTDSYEVTAPKIFDFLYNDDDSPIGVMITLQEKDFFLLRYQEHDEEINEIKNTLHPFFKNLPLNYEKLLLVDLYRLAIDAKKFGYTLPDGIAKITLAEHHELCGKYYLVKEKLQKEAYNYFCETLFKKWREENFKDFLAEKRKEEKAASCKHARPYVEYLEKEKQRLFSLFWQEHEGEIVKALFSERSLFPSFNEIFESSAFKKIKKVQERLTTPHFLSYLKTLRSFQELDRPLLGIYRGLKGDKEKHLAATFYPAYGWGYARSQAYRSSTTIGSIFKLVPAYEALRQRYLAKEKGERISDLNPLVIVDDKHRTYGKESSWNVGYTLDGHTIPMFYKGGRLPRSEHPKIGKVDLIHALEASSNPYFSLLAGDVLEDPEDLARAAGLLGFGEKTGVDLPGEFPGKIPKDLAYNRTGLYAMAIGQHSLCGTPLQTAVLLSALANGGEILKPLVLEKKVLEGQEIPVLPEVRWKVFLPYPIQHLLLTGLRQVVRGEKGTARDLKNHFSSDFIECFIGKTSTAESIERMSLDGTSGSLKLKHIWFGGIAYQGEGYLNPELVVVVYFRLGEFGRDAAPIAAKMVQKWREIQKRHELEMKTMHLVRSEK